ncbi:hypothetical protein [Aliikangiella sp. IMCC44359]|uniref:hypothetical protein n=1 Tax=Aliikangiella sp. IMCC44359 TaxID=3459125 RepID=UPI00403A9983
MISRKLIKNILVFIVLLMTSCHFDSDRQKDLRYPITLMIKNQSTKQIKISSIYSHAEASGGFTLKGQLIQPNQEYSIQVSENVFEDIKLQHYSIDGSCGEMTNWLINGKAITQQVIDTDNQWAIILTIDKC